MSYAPTICVRMLANGFMIESWDKVLDTKRQSLARSDEALMCEVKAHLAEMRAALGRSTPALTRKPEEK